MNTQQVTQALVKLMQLDIDAIQTYQQAIEKITHTEIKQALTDFQATHRTHVVRLKEKITQLGETPPKETPDLKGYLLEGFTALRSVTGTEGALKAMESNEQLTNKYYKEALAGSMPEDIQKMVKTHYEDEQRHLQYIKDALNNKTWLK